MRPYQSLGSLYTLAVLVKVLVVAVKTTDYVTV